jgi:hypothetical protein
MDAGDLSPESTPEFVIIDPDYHVFRKVAPSEIIPTTATTRSGERIATVMPDDPEAPAPLGDLRDLFAEGEKDHLALMAGQASAEALADQNVLILGDAVRDPEVANFLAGMEFPVSWPEDGGFAFNGVLYDEAHYAVIATAAHPSIEGGGVTVFYGNSPEALPAAYLIPFYPNSLVVFESGSAMVREDIENPKRHPVKIR